MLENLYGKSESALIAKNNTQKFGVRSQPHNRSSNIISICKIYQKKGKSVSIVGSSCAIVLKITGISMSKMRTNLTETNHGQYFTPYLILYVLINLLNDQTYSQ